MIAPDRNAGFADLAARLAARAAALGKAHAEILAMQSRDDPLRWRKAWLLWPLFARN